MVCPSCTHRGPSASFAATGVKTQANPTVTLVRNEPVNTARRTLIEESMGCEDDQAMLQGA
jgi:hypothetical protein